MLRVHKLEIETIDVRTVISLENSVYLYTTYNSINTGSLSRKHRQLK